jgi:hypothetical protein
VADDDSPAARPAPSRRALLLLFLLALAVRVALVLAFQTHQPGSPRTEMETAARSLAAGGPVGGLFGPGPTANVSPAYPAVLSVVYRVWGSENVLPQQLLAALATTITLVPVLGWRLGLRPAVGWAAGLAAALLPVNATETDGAWEQPVIGLALAAVLLLAAALQDRDFRSPRLVAAFGLLMALGGLLAPQDILVTGAMAFLGAWVASRAGVPRLLASGAAVALLCLLAWAPWTARNYAELGGFVPLRSNFGLELYLGNNSRADGMGGTMHDVHPIISAEENERVQRQGELAYMREQGQIARDWIANHPGNFAALTARRFQQFWFPSRGIFWSASPRRGQIFAAVFGVSGALALAGLLWLVEARQRYRWLFVAGLFGPALLHLLTHLHGRYRYPIFALSLLVAFEVVFRLADRLRPGKRGAAEPSEAVTPEARVSAGAGRGS